MNQDPLDKSNLRQLIIDYPNQLDVGQKFAQGISVPEKEYSNFMVCGMGGSAIPGEMLISYLVNNQDIPFTIPSYLVRGYKLPPIASANSLVFISSYSGNTEETLACFNDALKHGATIVSFSSGGKVEQISKEYGIQHVKCDLAFDNFQPRYATTYSFAAMQQVLTNSGLCGSIQQLPKINAREFEVKGEELAKKGFNKTLIIYASSRFKFLAKLWKIKLNENTNTQAFWNYFPELNHNELEGFSMPRSEFKVTILRDEADHERNKKRMEITNEFYNNWGIDSEIIDLVGDTYLEKLINGMVLGDWFSYYLAIEYGIDPSPSDVIEKFKKRLA